HRWIRRYGMPDRREHRYIRLAVRKRAGLAEIDVFLGGVFTDASRLFILGQQRRENTAGGNMVLELESIADDFINSEVQRDRTDLEIESPSHEHVAIAEFASRFNQCLGLTENRWLQRYFEKIV